jgi:hypothetical protein
MPTSKELRDIAKELGIRKYSKMNKSELTTAIEGHVQSTKAPKTETEEPKLVLKEPAEASTVVRGADVRKGKPSNSPWVKFCREYAKENNVPYKEAMRQKDKYLAWKDSQSPKTEATE